MEANDNTQPKKRIEPGHLEAITEGAMDIAEAEFRKAYPEHPISRETWREEAAKDPDGIAGMKVITACVLRAAGYDVDMPPIPKDD